MIKNSWTSGLGGDWNTPAFWSLGIVPNDSATDADISQAGSYVVTIANGETETVDAVAMGNLSATLSVSGVLTLTGVTPSIVFLTDGTIATTQSGVIQGQGVLTQTSLINAGTLIADAGANAAFWIYAPIVNTGTLMASNGNLLIAEGISNLTGTTLTGGTYIASGFIPLGQTSASINQLAFGFTGDAVLAVDAATIILDGPASAIEGYTGAGTANAAQVPLEHQLQTIVAGGTLELLDGRNFVATNTLLDAGMLLVSAGSLSTPNLTIAADGTLILASGALSAPAGTIAAGGTLVGYGFVYGPLTNQGAVIASSGTLGSLDFQAPVTGTGTLTVLAGSTLLLPGGSAGTMNVGGLLFDTGTLMVSGTVTGTGTIVVEHGGALEIGGSATPSLSFAGDDVTVTLDQPAGYQGTLVGFSLGDTLVLDGLLGTSATVVNGNTLAVTAGGTTIDTIHLAGNNTGAIFTATTVGGNTVVRNTAGAAARNDLAISLVNVSNPINLAGSLVSEIENELSLAAANWGKYITGAAPLRISLSFVGAGDFGSELALGSPGGLISNGQTINGHPIYIPDGLYTLQTGDYAAGVSDELRITVIASATNLENFYINEDPAAGTAVPAGKVDLLSVLTHEIGHGLGFTGVVVGTPASGSSPVSAGAAEAIYDSFIQDSTISGTIVATFNGPNAEAAYATAIGSSSPVPVPLFYGTPSVEDFYHVTSAFGATLAGDLMSPFVSSGTSVPISNIDLGILKDIGIPVTANVECFGRGTLIETTRGQVAVEDLTLHDQVVTMGGTARPIIWIGRRRVDCRRHPNPDRVLPIRIVAGAFAPNVPSRDLYLSPNHAIHVGDVLIPAYCLRNDMTVLQPDRHLVEYFHVELPTHDILLAEGLPVESYLECGNRHAFANAGTVTSLFAEFAGDNWEMSGYAPLMLRGPEVDAARALLTARAAELAMKAFRERLSANSCPATAAIG